MRPDHDYQKLHVSGKNRGYGSSAYSQRGESQFSVDQKPVEHKVHHNGCHAGLHGDYRLPAFAERRGIGLHDAEGRKARKHYHQVFQGPFQRKGKVPSVIDIGQEETYELRAEKSEDKNRNCRKAQSQHKLEAERVADPLLVVLAHVLRGEDSGARNGPEDAQVEHEDYLVDYGDGGHGLGSQASDHDVVQKVHEVGESVLNHDGQRNEENRFEKGLVPFYDLEHGEITVPDASAGT